MLNIYFSCSKCLRAVKIKLISVILNEILDTFEFEFKNNIKLIVICFSHIYQMISLSLKIMNKSRVTSHYCSKHLNLFTVLISLELHKHK